MNVALLDQDTLPAALRARIADGLGVDPEPEWAEE